MLFLEEEMKRFKEAISQDGYSAVGFSYDNNGDHENAAIQMQGTAVFILYINIIDSIQGLTYFPNRKIEIKYNISIPNVISHQTVEYMYMCL